jgi:hypothetical protein
VKLVRGSVEPIVFIGASNGFRRDAGIDGPEARATVGFGESFTRLPILELEPLSAEHLELRGRSLV